MFEILVLIVSCANASNNQAHTDVSSKIKGLQFGLSLHLHPYFVYGSSEGSDESAHMPETSLLAYVISAKISYAGPYMYIKLYFRVIHTVDLRPSSQHQ